MGINVQILLTNIQSLRKLRYLEVSHTDMVELPDSVTSLSNLQTLDLTNCELKVIPDSISGLKNLRFLNLSDNPFEKLPASVVTLSNLGTLDINTCKNLEALPDSVRGLSRLRIFDFKNCPLLKELPEDLGTLTQLRYLSLYDTQIRVLPESCANLSNLEYVNLCYCEVPKYVKNWTKLRKFVSQRGNILGAGELIFLERLNYSVPKQYAINEAECNVGIEELRNLKFLEDLYIWNLQNVEDPADAESTNLKGKQNLHELCLHWSSNSSHHHLEVFEALQPPTGLRNLTIQNFMGEVFPKWMCAASGLPNLVSLDFQNCKGIKKLPDIVQTPRLARLSLRGMHLESLDIGGFPSLIILDIEDMFLQELCYSYPSPFLQFLGIFGCKRLTEIPSLPCLLHMGLEKIDPKLVYSVGRSQTSLTTLFLENIDGLVYFPISILQNNSNLRILKIEGCNQFQGFGITDYDKNENQVAPGVYSSSLQDLRFYDCPVLQFLPDLRGWTSLRKLAIFNCPQVKESLTYDLKSLSFLEGLRVDFI
ncbi:putative disease resistance protein RGA3 isoform X2 [Papaver somniferum]|uniref:putative disease resistance protein RGA3 isoform X2 n=1 Tax=Papaver somniferum TaxID=3469 RepID=UPI000E70302F|nr:putative disease resistance protein RGA3 isoform X2 [Papaver somniferum]